MSDLQKAFDTIIKKQSLVKTAWNYYNGDQPLKYSTERLKEAFDRMNTRFVQNWCALVVDSVLERLQLSGVDVDNKDDNEEIDMLWSRYHIDVEAMEVHRTVEVTSEAYVIIWKEEDTVDFYVNDPEMCHAFYKADKPKVKEYAAKMWQDGDEWHMTLYYPDRFEYYTAKSKDVPSSANSFKMDEDSPKDNPYKVIPVFHFKAQSDLKNILTMQDAINKLFADMMVASEYGSFPQRYIINNGNVSALKNGANIIWNVPGSDGEGQDTEVGQFEAAPLAGYLEAMGSITNNIAIISRTPKHYFMNSGANISGDALIAMEAPLVKKVQSIQKVLKPVWQEAMSFMMLLEGKQIDPVDINLVWEPILSVQPLAEAQAMKLNFEMGVPIVTIMRWMGKTTAEIQQLLDDMKKQKAIESSVAQAVLNSIRDTTAQENTQENDADTSQS